ncbi:hypothetical protein [Glycomyces dulcitolivorans]|uniref:hypothetical protein n=1 Tax=Glycomyces dulcitolivorans TaxID=2200759 RepID=UPI000DD2ED39|nr:hypothetical protein [Glycomyces dulcitolivorans]
MSINCALPGSSPRRGTAKRFTRAEHFDSFAELLFATRVGHRLDIGEVAILTNTKAHMVARFESARSIPHMLFLRGLRDALDLPLAWLECCIDHFAWANASEELRNSQEEEEFLGLADTPIGSKEEKKRLDRLWLKYDYIPKAVARRIVFNASEREDFAQEAQISLRSAVLMHLPYLGKFQSYAWKRCEGKTRGVLSAKYYGETPEALRRRHARVLKAMREHQAEHGCRPSTYQLMSATGLTWGEVMDSEHFHHIRQHEVSFDDPCGGNGRTYGDFI